VGTIPKTQCKAKVVLKDAKGVIRGSDVSDNYFAIEPLVPDLIETSVDNPPATALPGSSFSVTDTAKNQGNEEAGASSTRYYLSGNNTKDSMDILLTGKRSVPAPPAVALPAGESSTGTVEVTIPSSTAAGTYYLLACADDLKAVAESNETNNCINSSTTVQIQRPDLVETSVSNPPAASLPGNSFSVTDTAKNQGNADAGTSTTQYYLSVDKMKGATDILLTGSRDVPALAVGESSTGKVDVAITSGIAAGAYYLLACADDLKAVAESNETNNCIASTSRVQISGPDLIETFLSIPPLSARVGSTFSVTDTVKNQGDVDAGPSATQYYLSGDKIKGSTDILLEGGRYVIGLAPGETLLGTVSVKIPSDAAPGAYYLLACADDMEAVDETDEKNNCIASTTTVQVAP
jgi:subtilase family serine protease